MAEIPDDFAGLLVVLTKMGHLVNQLEAELRREREANRALTEAHDHETDTP